MVKAPKRRRSKISGLSDEGSSHAEETESASANQPVVEPTTLLPEEAVVLRIAVA